MKLAIHNTRESFSQRWMAYCDKKGIPYKVVDCYANNIVRQLDDCDVLLWHHQQGNPKDILFAKELLFALEQSGKKVFPDFRTNWHFDDKVGQKYLLEALGIEAFVPSWVFYSRTEALAWVKQASFPKVFKLRGGAGSQNVQLVKSRPQAARIVRRAFGRGFPLYDRWGSLKERWRKYRLGKAGILDVLKGIVRLVLLPPYAKIAGRERGYVYFQEYIPGNDSDTRIIVIDNKAFALKRMNRKDDFRASGSGDFRYAREEFDVRCVDLAFRLTEKLAAQCVAYDFVFDSRNDPRLVEISFGYAAKVYDPCEGYWDQNLEWHAGQFDPYGWMVDIFYRHSVKVI